MAKNLWGELNDLPIVKTPLAMLREQADALTEATKGVLKGVIDTKPAAPTAAFRYTLDVLAPALNSYRYTAARIEHGIELYPVILTSPGLPASIRCVDENEFETVLGAALSSDNIRKVLASLVSQATK